MLTNSECSFLSGSYYQCLTRFLGIIGSLIDPQVFPSRTELMNLICVTYLDQLELYTKAILINALLKFGLRAHHNAQLWATTLFLSVNGADVTMLKNVLDNYSEFYSLHYFVYNGLIDVSLQQKVMEHIAQNKVYPDARHSPASLKYDFPRSYPNSLSISHLHWQPSSQSHIHPHSYLHLLLFLPLFSTSSVSDVTDKRFWTPLYFPHCR